jgi:glutaredoxin
VQEMGGVLSWLRWLWPGSRPASAVTDLQVILYTRAGCHLCEKALEILRREQRRYHFSLSVVDVYAEPGLAQRHGNQVPVVTVKDQVRFRGEVNSVLLSRLLRAEASRRHGDRRGRNQEPAGP